MQLDSVRVQDDKGEAILSVVCNGKRAVYRLTREKLLILLETAFEALRRQEAD